jgi:YgiT-type zinc finger domain-containing protein
MCGSKKLRREKRDVILKSRNKKINDASIWICENCGEEFLDDASREKFYEGPRAAQRRKALAA